MWGARTFAVVLAAVALTACETNTTMSVDTDADITQASVQTGVPKSQATLLGIDSASQLDGHIKRTLGDRGHVIEETADRYVVTLNIASPTEADVVDVLAVGRDEEWDIDTAAEPTGQVTVGLTRRKIDVNPAGDIAPEPVRYVTLELPHSVEKVETLPAGLSTLVNSTTVRLSVDRTFFSVTVTAEPESEPDSTATAVALLGMFLLVLIAGWTLTIMRGRRHEGPSQHADETTTPQKNKRPAR